MLKLSLLLGDGSVTVLKAKAPIIENEIIDASFMSAKALRAFIKDEIADAKKQAFSSHCI